MTNEATQSRLTSLPLNSVNHIPPDGCASVNLARDDLSLVTLFVNQPWSGRNSSNAKLKLDQKLDYTLDDSGSDAGVRASRRRAGRWPRLRGGTIAAVEERARAGLLRRAEDDGGQRVDRPKLAFSPPRLLFEQAYVVCPTRTFANYDVSPDGQRFLMVKSAAGSEHLNVVLNWQSALGARERR
jgi:hypothetical protein